MCDALSRNVPKLNATLVANCSAQLGEVFGYDEQAREQSLSPNERLQFHQEHSGPVMEKLRAWSNAQFEERKVELNSGLGQAI